MNNLKYIFIFWCSIICSVSAFSQNITNSYVSKVEIDGTLYHIFPVTIFDSKEEGNFTYDITYKSDKDNLAVINFTYQNRSLSPADSIKFFINENVVMEGKANKLYAEPKKKIWIHRYSFSTPIGNLYDFYSKAYKPKIVIYSDNKKLEYYPKDDAWKSYSKVGFRIFEMIKLNDSENKN